MHDTDSRCVDNGICFVCSTDLTKSFPPSNQPPSPAALSFHPPATPFHEWQRFMALFVHGPRPESPYPNYMSLCVSVIFYVDIAMRLKMRNGHGRHKKMDGAKGALGGIGDR